MTTWMVRVEGHNQAIKNLARLLPEGVTLRRIDEQVFLVSELFEEEHEAGPVRKKAMSVLDAVNLVGPVHFPDWLPVTLDAIFEFREDGTQHVTKHLSASIGVSAVLSATPTVIHKDGTESEPPPKYGQEIKLAMNDPALRRALSFFREPTWPNLFKAYEIVRHAVGGDEEIRRREWATLNDLRRLRHTCQSPTAIGSEARHAVESSEPPAQPLAHSEAKALVAKLLEGWMCDKLCSIGEKSSHTEGPIPGE